MLISTVTSNAPESACPGCRLCAPEPVIEPVTPADAKREAAKAAAKITRQKRVAAVKAAKERVSLRAAETA